MPSISPIVSVVIPTNNRELLLSRALKSVVDQSYTNWEAIVVDNHSQDNTDEVIYNFGDSRIKLLKIHNKGIIAASRNLGIKAACGDWIAFLDSDDWWSPTKLERSLQFLNSGADIVYHDLFIVKNEKQKYFLKRAKTFQVQEPAYEHLIHYGNALTNSSVVVRKTLLEQVGGLSEKKELIAWEDYDCWLRIAKHTERFVRINEPLGYYWAAGGNASSTQQTMKTLQEFHSRYLKGRSDDVPAWFHYGKGRSLFYLKSYIKAIPHLVQSTFSGLPIMKLKSIITIISIYLISMLKRKKNEH